MTFMDRLPTVISCCFCCFLRAGTVMIAIFSFLTGVIFAPNVTHAKGFWRVESGSGAMSYYSSVTESGIRVTLGIFSIMLCIISVLLLVGSLCNMPLLIEIYQWGLLVHCITTCLIFFVLAMFCFFVHTNCLASGFVLLGMIICSILITIYFIIVSNSLRMSLRYLSGKV